MSALPQTEAIEMLQARVAELEHDNEALHAVNAKALADLDEARELIQAIHDHTNTRRSLFPPIGEWRGLMTRCKRWIS